MLNGMLVKGQQALQEEQVQYAAYNQFCQDTTAEKERLIAESEEQITVLTADIEKYQTDSDTLSERVKELDSEISTWEGDLKAAEKTRELERSEYVKLHQDYSETIDAITQAIPVLQAVMQDRPQAVSMLSNIVAMPQVPKTARRMIEAFLAESQDPLDVTAPEANAYEFRSQSIVDMLEKLKDKFVQERSELEKEELNRRHSYEMLAQDLKASIQSATEARTDRTEVRARNLQLVATKQGDLQETQTTKADTETYLKDLKATCSMKATDYEKRQELRSGEINAIKEAITVLSSDKVQVAAGRLSLEQQRKAKPQTALAQLRSSPTAPNQLRVAAYLHEQAERLGSHVLSALVLRVRDDPFSKVKQMIKDLIMRLEEEASEEAQHKGWCDKELAENEHNRNTRTSEVESLKSQIDELESSIAQLTLDIARTGEEVTVLEKEVNESTVMRNEEKATNEATIKDAQEAQVAVSQAITVLQEFYAQASEATALVQKVGHSDKKQEPPPIFDSPYRGLTGESTGVLGLLQVIQSDFARLESDTRANEVTANQDYQRFMTDSSVTKAQLEKDIEHFTTQRQTQENSLVDKKNDLASSERELSAANEYYERLKPSCVDAGMTFEEREQRRQEEIESLQEALRILNGEDIAAVQIAAAQKH